MLRFFVMGTALLLAGCATVDTSRQASGQRGIAYHLPQGLVRLTIVDAEGTITVSLAGPVMTADPRFRLSSMIHHGSISDDDVKITVDARTNLLSTVSVSSVGRLDDIIQNAVRSAFALQASESQSGDKIFEGLYRLDELPRAVQEGNAALLAHQERLCRAPADQAATRRCNELRALNATPGGAIQIDTPGTGPSELPLLRTGDRVDLTPCAMGVCYRPLTPIRMRLRFGGRSDQTQAMLFPDEAQVMAVNLRSGVFADQKYDLAFTEGVLTSYSQNSRSELVGLVSLPLTIVETIISAPARVLGARRQAMADEQSYLSAVSSLATQRQQMRALCARQPEDCPETALRVIRAHSEEPPAPPSDGNSFDDN